MDELGEHMWWKRYAMNDALQDFEALYRCEEPNCPLSSTVEGPAVTSWCTSTASRRLFSVISIGDNEAEMQAAHLAAHGYDDWRGSRRGGVPAHEVSPTTSAKMAKRGRGGSFSSNNNSGLVIRNAHRRHSASGPRQTRWSGPFVKLIKFRESPHVRGLSHELADVAELLPNMVMLRNHIRVDVGRNELLCARFPWSSMKFANPVARLLALYDIDTSLFREGLDQLTALVESGAVKLMLDPNGDLVCAAELVLLQLHSRKDGKVLVETGKVFPDGRMRRNVWLPGCRKLPQERSFMAAHRVAEERCMLGDLELTFCAEEEKEVRQIKTTSPSFPGLPTVYRKEIFNCYVDVETSSQQELSRAGLPDERKWQTIDANGNTRYFAWTTKEEFARPVEGKADQEQDVGDMVLTPVALPQDQMTGSRDPSTPTTRTRPWLKWDLETERHLRVATVG